MTPPRLILLWAAALSAQPVHVGIKGGARFTNDIDTFFATPETKMYAVGPMVVAGLPYGFQLEGNALYRRLGFRTFNADILGGYTSWRARGNSWEFPILVRRKLWRGVYAGTGYVPRVIRGREHFNILNITGLNPPTFTFTELDGPGRWETTHGILAEVGIEKVVWRLRFAPEIRYVRWNKPALEISGSRGFEIRSTQNQVDLLLGITF